MNKVRPVGNSPRKNSAKESGSDITTRKYVVTSNMRLSLVESPHQREFPKCDHCGQGHYWNVVWPPALVLSKYLARRGGGIDLSGKSALVVGCGAGLESIAAAKMGADVRVLDHCAEALRLTRENCHLNGVTNIKTAKCCWLDHEKVGKLRRHDVLIGCEVLYNIGKKSTLTWLLTSALKKGGIALFAEPEREGAKDPRTLLDGPLFRIVSTFVHPASDGVEVTIYKVQRSD